MKWVTGAVLLCTTTLAAQENLPAGPGQSVVVQACVQCHDSKWIVSQHKSEAAWRRTVDEMIWRGAPLMPGEADVVTRYLLTLQTAKLDETLPPGNGRDLVAAACIQCHDLSVTAAQRKTREEWQHSVERMVRLGAPLDAAEIRIVTTYLANAFGPQETRTR